MKPKDKRELEAAGFIQNQDPHSEPNACEQCGVKVSGRREWIRRITPIGGHFSGETDFESYCGPCARFFVEVRKQREASQ